MKNLILDANSLLRYLLNDIPNQAEQTQALIKQAQQGKVKLFLLEVTITEVVFTLEKSYKWKKRQVGEVILKLISSPLLEIEKRDILLEAINEFQDKSLSLIDCLLVAEAKKIGASLFTFDKKLTSACTT